VLRPLWRCPKCGHRFVTRNIWHSCSHYTLDHYFKGCDPMVRKVFDRFLAVVKRSGPVTVVPQKTRIVFMVRVRFAGGVARKNWFRAGLWLKRRVSHPCLIRVESFTLGNFGHHFRLNKLSDVDKRLAALGRESYAIGCQKHVAPKS